VEPKIFVAVPVPTLGKFWSDTGFGSGSRQYLVVFKKKRISQNLAFSMSEAAYFSESWLVIFGMTSFA
jgi:hypothetical protein